MLKQFVIAKNFRMHISKPKKYQETYFLIFRRLEGRPAGAFSADKILFWARKASRRGLLGKIFDKLRIQGRMQILKKKSQKALNHVFIG